MKTFALTGDSQLHAEVRFAKNRKLPRHYRLSMSAAIEFLSLPYPCTIKKMADPQQSISLLGVISREISAKLGVTYPETNSLLDSEQLGLIFIETAEDDTKRNASVLRSAFKSMLERSLLIDQCRDNVQTSGFRLKPCHLDPF